MVGVNRWLYGLALVALWGRLAAGTTCYFPEGNVADDYTPCSDNGDSFCCNEDSICLSNGLCTSMHQPYVLGRGACTSQNWNESSVCNDVCHGITTAWGSACSLILYSDVNGKKLYCPNSITSNGTNSIGCANGVSPIQVATGKPIAGKAYLAQYTLNSALTTTNTSSSSSSPADGDQVSRATLAAVGAGVGVPLGLLAMASLGFGFHERRKRVRLQNSPGFVSQIHHTPPPRSNLEAKELTGHMPLHELGDVNRHELAGNVP
ncbi:hypothetical protein BO78DRAFT_464786 [Aspergillus sclerotiicarbonarius CBS 121057]|uniref:Mid2 domain-containing protein n=1 Tax=Aspergillus sclerotiicarbonarius (strain CBS 121057 / IBT 28362) TaxID=1448318 RepID=A0A319EBR2_ASPSB|nr:hypothetical protein BO78DRAFT_464786 [Aspergillus sclerotiicarbonarius CBS 121057]